MSTYAVVDPTTGRTVREYPLLTDAALAAKLDLAAATHRRWGTATTPAERAELLRRAAAALRERREELALIISVEMGKPVAQGVREVDRAAAVFDQCADGADSLPAADGLAPWTGESVTIVRHEPVGVLLGVVPWHCPYYDVARIAAPHLVAGNTIVLKHATQCPASAAAIESLLLDSGFPPGAYQNLYISSVQLDAVIADHRVRGICVTGTDAAGVQAAETAGRHLKRVVLDVAGPDVLIVLSTDDLPATVGIAAAHLYVDPEQPFGAHRFIVVDELYDEFLAGLTRVASQLRPGDPSRGETLIGPLPSSALAAGIEDHLHRAVEHGARVAHGGSRDGSFFEPTVVVDITADNPVAPEAFVGPFVLLFHAAGEEDAIRLANNGPHALRHSVFTTDAAQATRVAVLLDAGTVDVNPRRAGRPERSHPCGEGGAFLNHKLIRIAP
ncbi:aldehyde dehydrogenase family protein [Nocardioides ultimimeridianus]